MTREGVQTRLLELLGKATGGTVCSLEEELMGGIGLSSIEVMDLLSGVEQEFRIRIPSRQLRLVSTAEDLAELICEKAGIL